MQIRNDRFAFVPSDSALPRGVTPDAVPARTAPVAQQGEAVANTGPLAAADPALASIDELGSLLHQLSLGAGGLLRGSAPAPLGQGASAAPAGGPVDVTAQHPVYGAYLGEWLETHRAQPGRALLGLLRTSMSELRASISRNGSRFKPAGPSV
jgi:hypothetical protein